MIKIQRISWNPEFGKKWESVPLTILHNTDQFQWKSAAFYSFCPKYAKLDFFIWSKFPIQTCWEDDVDLVVSLGHIRPVHLTESDLKKMQRKACCTHAHTHTHTYTHTLTPVSTTLRAVPVCCTHGVRPLFTAMWLVALSAALNSARWVRYGKNII